MINFLKKNWVTVLIVLATVVLAGVAIFTALRLYQLRQTSVAPNVPESRPAAAGGVPSQQCTLSFTITAASGSPTPTGSASPTPTSTASATPTGTPQPTPLSCGDTCTSNADCTNSMVCSNGRCRNPSCLAATNCLCATATPTGTATSSATPIAGGTPVPVSELPVAGVSFPTIIGAFAGIMLLVGAVMLAL